MSIILSLIEERNNKLLNYDEKKEERAMLVERLEALDKELNSFDKSKLVSEIDELTECAVKLGLIQVESQSETENQLNEVCVG